MVSTLAPSAAKNAAASEPCELPEPAAEAQTQPADALSAAAPPALASPPPPGAELSAALRARWALLSAQVACELDSLPNSAFAVAPPAPHPGYTPAQRLAAAAWTAALYGAFGLVCGGAGQARG